MEKKQYELCLEILRRFNKAKILDHLVLIGSWAVFFYKDYFASAAVIDYTVLKTRDMDFLISTPHKIKDEVDIPLLLEDLGFLPSYSRNKGYLKLDHPDLIVEFLVQDKGRGMDRPYPIPQLGINAQTLRFLDLLSENTIKVELEDFNLTLPHPINLAFHKLIISQRRNDEDKTIKDIEIAVGIIKTLVNRGEIYLIKKVFDSLSTRSQIIIKNILKESDEKEFLEVLE